MNVATQAQAKSCKESLPVGFGLETIITIVEVIYYAFEAWKACHGSTSTPSAVSSTILNQVQGDGQSYSPPFFRRAQRQVHRAERHCSTPLTVEQRQALTVHMLNHAANVSENEVLTCCSEPPDVKDMPYYESY
jgi:hypothetical protein